MWMRKGTLVNISDISIIFSLPCQLLLILCCYRWFKGKGHTCSMTGGEFFFSLLQFKFCLFCFLFFLCGPKEIRLLALSQPDSKTITALMRCLEPAVWLIARTQELVDTPARVPTITATALGCVFPGVPVKENPASSQRTMYGRACVNI